MAARGLDIPQVDWIVQFDPPDCPKVLINFFRYSSIQLGHRLKNEGVHYVLYVLFSTLVNMTYFHVRTIYSQSHK